MDIKVITRHAPSNYGSLLQAIATQTLLGRLELKCEIIDYVRDDERGLKGILTALNGKKEWSGNPLKRIAYVAMRYPEEKIAEVKFGRMRHRYLKMTPRCRTHEGLSQLYADIFMTGSDQVWGPTMNGRYDGAYFLSFVKDKPKIAYAASFGRTEFTSDVVRDYKRLLSRYSAISVREDTAVRLLASWGMDCAGQVLDPTLMLTADDWNEYVGRAIRGKYVLVYQIHNDGNLGAYAKGFAKAVGLPLIRISPYLHQTLREGRLKWLPNVGEFLSYIKNCEYFITDSFHGTAFALTFNRQFIEILPNNKTGSRNQSILRLAGLTDRIVSDYDDYSFGGRLIDYGRVNALLEFERQKSWDILERMCKLVEGNINQA